MIQGCKCRSGLSMTGTVTIDFLRSARLWSEHKAGVTGCTCNLQRSCSKPSLRLRPAQVLLRPAEPHADGRGPHA